MAVIAAVLLEQYGTERTRAGGGDGAVRSGPRGRWVCSRGGKQE